MRSSIGDTLAVFYWNEIWLGDTLPNMPMYNTNGLQEISPVQIPQRWACSTVYDMLSLKGTYRGKPFSLSNPLYRNELLLVYDGKVAAKLFFKDSFPEEAVIYFPESEVRQVETLLLYSFLPFQYYRKYLHGGPCKKLRY